MEIFGKHLKRNKKGSLLDIIFITVAITFFAIVVLIGVKIATEVEDNLDANTAVDATTQANIEDVRVKYTNTVDNMFLFLLIFMAIATLILAALVRIHPIFIPIFFIGWVLVIFLAGILSNIYQSMADDVNLVAISDQFVFMNYIMDAIPIIVGIFGIILMVVMYKLWSAAQ